MNFATSQQFGSMQRVRKCSKRELVRRCRLGSAAIELAVCLPVIAVVTFGAIEMANGVYLKQAAYEAAYEAARVATTGTGNSTTAESRATDVLTARGVANYSITISPTVDSSTEAGTQVTAQVTVNTDGNSSGTQIFLQSKTVTATVVMVKSS